MRISDWSSDVCSSDLPDVNDNVVVLDAILDATVADGQDPTVGDPLTLTVDEDDLPGGTDSDPEPAGDRINDGTLEFTAGRSEESRGGTECVSTCRSWWTE